MRASSDGDTFRAGAFDVITSWPALKLSEPRCAVVQYDHDGPILRLGPFVDYEWACRQCRRVAREGFIGEHIRTLARYGGAR
jgi:hypothetical protein